jgi:5-methylcytosine-specific restriction endonuclease McrA
MNKQSVAIVVLVLFATAAVVIFVILSKRRRIVSDNSAALAALRSLNQGYQTELNYPAPISCIWVDTVNSKAKFDRYDLNTLFHSQLAVQENLIANQISAQLKAASVFREYQGKYEEIGSKSLGGSRHQKISPQSFTRIEGKLFKKQMMRAPVCAAQVRCIVRYTSPKGQNSYTNEQGWNFDQLQAGLVEMRQIRQSQSTATFLRQQERNRMTASLRYQVIKRDNSRCRNCGASAQNGASLHVDHIVPVSRGGKTEMSNLQTLCATCNLGKSHRH